MNSLKDELRYLFSGEGMPYEKVAIIISIIVTMLFTTLLGNNFIKDAHVAVIDLDNSNLSHQIIDQINASTYMEVTSVLNTPVKPETLFYKDANVAVFYFPRDLEKDFYAGQAINIGAIYDNTNSAQSGSIKSAISEIIAENNQSLASEATSSGINVSSRILFNPASSTSNSTTQGFLIFFSSIFFTLATIGMVPRLRLGGKLEDILLNGTPFDIIVRLIPYGASLIIGLLVGLVILRLWGDMIFSGQLITYVFTLVFWVFALGLSCILMGWNAINPGAAAGRVILFIPGGFIFGGVSVPIPMMSEWVRILTHIFPLTWEFHFIRDIISRGANFSDISSVFGMFLLYTSGLLIILYLVFYKARNNLLQKKETENLSEDNLNNTLVGE